VADISSFQALQSQLEVARSFPETAETMLLDTLPHRRNSCELACVPVYGNAGTLSRRIREYLYVLSGRGTSGWETLERGRILRRATYSSSSAVSFTALPQHPRRASGLSGHRHAAARPEGHHLCKPGRRHPGDIHPGKGTAVFSILSKPGATWSAAPPQGSRPKCSAILLNCAIRRESAHSRRVKDRHLRPLVLVEECG